MLLSNFRNLIILMETNKEPNELTEFELQPEARVPQKCESVKSRSLVSIEDRWVKRIKKWIILSLIIVLSSVMILQTIKVAISGQSSSSSIQPNYDIFNQILKLAYASPQIAAVNDQLSYSFLNASSGIVH